MNPDGGGHSRPYAGITWVAKRFVVRLCWVVDCCRVFLDIEAEVDAVQTEGLGDSHWERIQICNCNDGDRVAGYRGILFQPHSQQERCHDLRRSGTVK